MPEYVRVRDKDSGHELSIITSASRRGYEVLDEPATASNGVPLPPKHKTRRKSVLTESLSSKKEPGQKATNQNEES